MGEGNGEKKKKKKRMCASEEGKHKTEKKEIMPSTLVHNLQTKKNI